MKTFITKNRLITLISMLVLLILWKILSMLMASALLLPSPEESMAILFSLLSDPSVYPSIGSTVARGILGFILAFIPGIWLGIWAGSSPAFHAALKPLLVSIRSTPVISFILLALIWFRVEQVPVFIAFLTMFPILCTNVIDGIRYTQTELLEMAAVYRVPRKRLVREVYLPAIAPFILSGTSNAMGFGWRAVIIGEVLSQPRFGIGSLMQYSQTYLLVAELIAWTVIAIMISYLFEWLIRMAEKKIIVWK